MARLPLETANSLRSKTFLLFLFVTSESKLFSVFAICPHQIYSIWILGSLTWENLSLSIISYRHPCPTAFWSSLFSLPVCHHLAEIRWQFPRHQWPRRQCSSPFALGSAFSLSPWDYHFLALLVFNLFVPFTIIFPFVSFFSFM